MYHLSTELQDKENDSINILKINKNAVMIIDSDKHKKDDVLNNTKLRIIKEIIDINGYAWVTDGREIENYIHIETLNKMYDTRDMKPLGNFANFPKYLDAFKKGEGSKFQNNKVLFAEKITRNITLENLKEDLKLSAKLVEVVEKINMWNKNIFY
ncbi:MAG TPA: hypothetical protein PKE39_15985 [Ignavibacteria bacterium]|nr:hypothetical protein [Ignavibacteria bacterium]HMR00524.1 hypothetical protein [Ignavibacteria bacterium]